MVAIISPAWNFSILACCGDHCSICGFSSGKTPKYISVRDLFYKTCGSATLSLLLEEKNLMEETLQQPAGVIIPNWCCGGKLALDVPLISPLNTSIVATIFLDSWIRSFTRRTQKDNLIRTNRSNSNLNFLALAMETSGWDTLSASGLLDELLVRYADSSFKTRGEEKTPSLQQVWFIVQKQYAVMIISRQQADNLVNQLKTSAEPRLQVPEYENSPNSEYYDGYSRKFTNPKPPRAAITSEVQETDNFSSLSRVPGINVENQPWPYSTALSLQL